MGKADPELLISNPLSTNIESYPILSSRLKTVLETTIKTVNKNCQLKGLFPHDSRARDVDLYNFLIGHTALHPRLLHELYRLTTTATRNAFLASFTNTRTMILLFNRNKKIHARDSEEVGYEDIYYHVPKDLEINDIDVKMLEFLSKLYKTLVSTPKQHRLLKCPTSLAHDMRHFTWIELLPPGERFQGVTVAHPSHQFIMCKTQDGSHDECSGDSEHLVFMLDNTDHYSLLCTTRKNPAYIGSRTREKTVGKIYTIASQARHYKAAERAITNRLTAGFVVGGALGHRLYDHFARSNTLNNFNITINTHIHISTDTTGRFSRGQDNYVMHFQGLIHLGLSLILLIVTNNNTSAPAYHLHYRGKCCEEVIKDDYITGNKEIPKLESLEGNPLLYTKVQNFPSRSLSVYQGFKTTSKTTPEWAFATIILGRIRSRLFAKVVGSTDNTEYQSGSIGVQEVSRIHFPKIMIALSKLICLHVDSPKDHLITYLTAIPDNICNDIASILLFPEFLPLRASYLDVDGLADVYRRLNMITRTLNNKLKSLLIDHYDSHSWINTIEPFYITPSIKLNHALRMYSQLVYIKYQGKYEMKRLVLGVMNRYYSNPESVVRPEIRLATLLLHTILLNYDYQGYLDLWIDTPLIFCTTMPEAFLRSQRLTTLQKSILTTQGRYCSSMITLYDNYVAKIEYIPRSDSIEMVHTSTPAHGSQERNHWRTDQKYRLIGQVSTAYLKYYEMIRREQWSLTKSGLYVGEGEGSVARMISILTKQPVYYNYLVDKEKLPPHRGYQYIPGAFIDQPDMVRGGELAAITGEDLTEKNVRDGLIKLIRSHDSEIDIITCDAESNITQEIVTMVEIVKSVCILGLETKSLHLILKPFTIDPTITAYTGGMLQLVWNNISLLTVTMSSFENTECFFVCTNYNPKVTTHQIEHLAPLYVLVPRSVKNMVSSLIHYKEKRVASNIPFQVINKNWTKELPEHGMITIMMVI